MEIELDQNYLLRTMEELINTPSPVSYYEEVNPLLERYGAELSCAVTFDRKRTGYIRIPGKSSEKTRCVGTHLDTLGLIVRHIDGDGMIRVRNLGGINFNNIEGESVTIHTREGKCYTGLVACQSHSVHVFDDARTLERNEKTAMILLDEDVHSREDVKALGIENGDIVSLEPHFTVTESGFIKSRFIDNKASVACSLTVLKYLKEKGIVPAYDVLFAFPHYEEIGHGGSYIPPEVTEYIAVDIGVIGPEHNGRESAVSICKKDNFSPYDRVITRELVERAREIGIDYVEDIFYHYGTDGNAAVRAGNNVAAAAFGMGTFSSHGVERTTVKAVMATAQLLAAYLT